MAAVNKIKFTIGGPESPSGSAETRTHVIPIRSAPGLDCTIEKKEDPAIIGRNLSAGKIPTSKDVNGSLPISPRACGGFGKLIKSVLGDADTPVQIGACLRVRYTGSEASCKFVADATGNTLTANVGDRGSEAVDDGFGTPGYQELGLSGKSSTDDTGLSTETQYNFKITVDGGEQASKSITTGTGTVTYAAMLVLLNAATADATWTLVSGDVRCMSKTVGDDSDILLAAGDTSDLLAALSSTPDAAVSGVSGIVDFDDARYDTITEIVTLVDSLTNYDCELVTGSGSLDCATNKVLAIAEAEGKNTWCYVWFGSTTSGVYRHTFKYQVEEDEHATYSIQKDGYIDNYLYDGCVVDTLSISAALKAFVEGEAGILGMDETAGQSESELDLEDVDPFIFSDGSFSLGDEEYTYIRDMSLNLEAGHTKEGYGQGSIARMYQQKGAYKGSGSITVRLDATSQALRAEAATRNQFALSFYFIGKTIAESIKEAMIIELPYCSIDSFEHKENAGIFDAGINYGVLYPKGDLYNNPITIHLLTTDVDEY